jgi:ABC-2 type transport system permease protein
MLKKEFIEVKRDYLTYILLITFPFLEVILFGYIINTDAKHLPTVIVAHDQSSFTNSLIQGLKTTQYFKIKNIVSDDREADRLLREGKIQFIIRIPNNFSRDIVRAKNPHILVEGDATDPIALGGPFNAVNALSNNILDRDLQGALGYVNKNQATFTVDTHAKYNPALIAQYHTVPGLLVTILTVALVMLTAISITGEYEHGTMELLLITPLRPVEVILGKIVPHVILGSLLFFLTIALSYWLFGVPFRGSLGLLTLCVIAFIISNLAVGLLVSIVSRSQFRSANLANLYIVPSILLSGFLFPFYAMPNWAQWVAEMLPPTHYLRLSTGIMLKGASFTEIWPDLWPILVFIVVTITISLKYYRNTLE